MGYTAFIFDFDYTLGDSTKGIVDSINFGLSELGLKSYTTEEIRKTIGMTMPDAFMHLTGRSDKKLVARFYELFTQKADEVMTMNTVLFNDTIPVLTRIKRSGLATGIATTKSHYRIDAILDKFGICDLVDVIIGGDDVKNAKPDPEALLSAANKLSVNTKDVLYVGDSVIDAEAAKSAHIDFFAVTTGTTSGKLFMRYPHIAVSDSLTGLFEHHIIC